MSYSEYAPLIDSGLVLALAFIVWGAYRELRRRKRAGADTQHPAV
jgi:hypothetical protein